MQSCPLPHWQLRQTLDLRLERNLSERSLDSRVCERNNGKSGQFRASCTLRSGQRDELTGRERRTSCPGCLRNLLREGRRAAASSPFLRFYLLSLASWPRFVPDRQRHLADTSLPLSSTASPHSHPLLPSHPFSLLPHPGCPLDPRFANFLLRLRLDQGLP